MGRRVCATGWECWSMNGRCGATMKVDREGLASWGAAAMSTLIQAAESWTQQGCRACIEQEHHLRDKRRGLAGSGGGGWGCGCWIVRTQGGACVVERVSSKGCRAGGGEAVGGKVASPHQQHAPQQVAAPAALSAVHRPANAGELALQGEVHARRVQKVLF